MRCSLLIAIATLGVALPAQDDSAPFRVGVSFPESLESEALDGRLLLMFSKDDSREPRFQITARPSGQQIFGLDVAGLAPGQKAYFDASSRGYPLLRLPELPPGEYTVQALLHRYETFTRSDGHVVKLPMDRGEGQQWNRAPGNLYSTPRKLRIEPGATGDLAIELDREVPPITPPNDTKYIKHIRIQSKLLTEFWGRPMHLGAVVLLPHGFDDHPEARYPLVINHGHFPATFGGFRETPPDPDLKPVYSTRFSLDGYNVIQQQEAHDFYKQWTSDDFPRFVIIKVQHANPYYDDSYAVNSQNLGPYGDAIMDELVPAVEKEFRCLGEGWARFTYGGSTGGWEALAVQVMYPDRFNGCFAACPDPIDFRAYTVVNLYEDQNAYFYDSAWRRAPRPGWRDMYGNTDTTLEQMNQLELVLGTRSRSGQQWDIWEAVYSPVGADGYPKRIWDKVTGVIDRDVARHWQQNYDLSFIMMRDWQTLGPKLRGKIHIYCGEMDNYYLNNAVYLTEQFLRSTTNPPFDGEITYGARDEHCWNGDPTQPNAISRLRYHTMYVDKILSRIRAAAPDGADLTSWRY